MSSEKKTPLGFCQWSGTDKLAREDLNWDNARMDAILQGKANVVEGKVSPMPTVADVGGSNPNLLDNPDFRINQRGKTIYDASLMTVDLWRRTLGTVSVLSEGVQISGDTQDFYQLLSVAENKGIHNGRYTLSSKIDGMVFSCSFDLDFSSLNHYENYKIGQSGCYVNVICNWNVMGMLLVGIQPRGVNRKIEWVKLEEGNTPTRHEPPHSVLELIKCQRYFQWLNGYYAVGASEADGLHLGINLPVLMRITPTFFQGFTNVQLAGSNGNSFYTDVKLSHKWGTASSLTLIMENPAPEKFTLFHPVAARIDGSLFFDANL